MQQPYIYLITDIRNGMRNVGQHCGRDENYFTGSKIIKSIIKKHGKEEAKKFLKKEIIVQGDFNQKLLNELERHYIRLYATRDPLGYNLTDGGNSINGGKTLPESHRLAIGLGNAGKKKTKRQIQNSLDAKLIKHGGKIILSAEHKEKIRITSIGRRYPNRKVPQSLFVKIAQYSLEGELIKIWDSVDDAKKATGAKHPGSVAKGYRETSGGFIWRYPNNNGYADNNITIIKKCNYTFRPKKIEQYSLDNNLIKVWSNLTEASKECRISKSSISFCANGKTKSTNGFIWKFVDKKNS